MQEACEEYGQGNAPAKLADGPPGVNRPDHTVTVTVKPLAVLF